MTRAHLSSAQGAQPLREIRRAEVRITRIVRSQRGFLARSVQDGHTLFVAADAMSLKDLRTGDIVAVQLNLRVVCDGAVFAPGAAGRQALELGRLSSV